MRRNIDRINAIRPRLLASLCSTTLLAHGSMTGRVQFSWLFFEKLARIPVLWVSIDSGVRLKTKMLLICINLNYYCIHL